MKPVSNSNISRVEYEKYHCVISTQQSGMYYVDRFKILNGIFTGELVSKNRSGKKTLHLTVRSDSLIIVHPSNLITIPEDNLILVAESKFSTINTIGLSVLIYFASGIVTAIYIFYLGGGV